MTWKDNEIEKTGMFNYSKARKIVEEFPYHYKFPKPSVTTDMVLISKNTFGTNFILLIKRGNDPFKGMWALPGGFLDMNESLKDCAIRELNEETGIDLSNKRDSIKFVGVYDKVDRDPRDRVIANVFASVIDKYDYSIKAGDDAKDVRWFQLNRLPELAFDHENIISDVKNMLERGYL